ncbi:hypothetical protein LINGRAHAP2_LOCUS7627, partial [Linum grandiflorum]
LSLLYRSNSSYPLLSYPLRPLHLPSSPLFNSGDGGGDHRRPTAVADRFLPPLLSISFLSRPPLSLESGDFFLSRSRPRQHQEATTPCSFESGDGGGHDELRRLDRAPISTISPCKMKAH